MRNQFANALCSCGALGVVTLSALAETPKEKTTTSPVARNGAIHFNLSCQPELRQQMLTDLGRDVLFESNVYGRVAVFSTSEAFGSVVATSPGVRKFDAQCKQVMVYSASVKQSLSKQIAGDYVVTGTLEMQTPQGLARVDFKVRMTPADQLRYHVLKFVPIQGEVEWSNYNFFVAEH